MPEPQWIQPPELPWELIRIHLNAVNQLKMKTGGQMSTTDPFDQPITLRQLLEAFESVEHVYTPGGTAFARTMKKLVSDVRKSVETDYVIVTFGNYTSEYIYKVVSQPERRVQVGDLVTVQGNSFSIAPQVVKVRKINVPAPKCADKCAKAVAIAPEDADRLRLAFGGIR